MNPREGMATAAGCYTFRKKDRGESGVRNACAGGILACLFPQSSNVPTRERAIREERGHKTSRGLQVRVLPEAPICDLLPI